MKNANVNLESGANYTAFHSGTFSDWAENSVELPGLGKVPGKLFLKDLLGFTSCEISINAMPGGGAMPFHHHHKENEEIYVFISGQGQIQIDGDTLDVKEGSIVRIAPKGTRIWRNTSNQTLVYLVLQMRDGSLRQYGVGDGVVIEKPIHWPT